MRKTNVVFCSYALSLWTDLKCELTEFVYFEFRQESLFASELTGKVIDTHAGIFGVTNFSSTHHLFVWHSSVSLIYFLCFCLFVCWQNEEEKTKCNINKCLSFQFLSKSRISLRSHWLQESSKYHCSHSVCHFCDVAIFRNWMERTLPDLFSCGKFIRLLAVTHPPLPSPNV